MKILILFFILLFAVSCDKTTSKLLTLRDSSDTHIYFANNITENDSLNILDRQYIYNGAGVALGDLNGDGLQDIFFAGNMVSNELYLNKENLVFEQVTEQAGLNQENRWSAGVSLVDINNDKKLDIYVSNTFAKDADMRKNQLFINQGNNKNGIPTFKEQATEYGLDIDKHTTQSVFLDYDKDGDLDLFAIVNISKSRKEQYLLLGKGNIPPEKSTQDLLFQNNNGKFTDVSKQANIQLQGLSLGVFVEDFNDDGWDDLYVSNDFVTDDILYINNQDGSFTNQISDYVKHQSFNSMGVDAGDLNNDGYFDFMVADMRPFRRQRLYQNFKSSNYDYYKLAKHLGYQYQVSRNVLQVANGIGQYNEVGYYTGTTNTDWSWSVLFTDFDNDGLKDIAITNGYVKDIANNDFADFIEDRYGSMLTSKQKKIAMLGEVKEPNMFYHNLGDFSFKDLTHSWTNATSSFSNGAAYADLDDDGDIDYVVNNINAPAFIYENTNSQTTQNKWLRIKLVGSPKNTQGIGSRISITTSQSKQQYTYNPTRGYLSFSSEIHFGLAEVDIIDSLTIKWADGKQQTRYHIAANQLITLDYENASEIPPTNTIIDKPLLSVSPKVLEPASVHRSNNFSDYTVQPIAPKMYTKNGPALCVGDLNSDGLEDLLIGGNKGQSTQIYLQDLEGWKLYGDIGEPNCNDMGASLLDIDGDGDLDCYLSSGSHFESEGCADQFFINDGKGNFTLQVLPEKYQSIKSLGCDYDKDGDIDLFLCMGVQLSNYPIPNKSILLQNNNGKLAAVDTTLSEILSNKGIIQDGLWSDVDGDGWMDLILIGDWMPITVIKNNHGKFKEITQNLGLENTNGWWSAIIGEDFDNDGDMDYIVGNQGLNSVYQPSNSDPIRLYAADFDNNNAIDPVMTYMYQGKEYPTHLKKNMYQQLNFTKKKFIKYRDYVKAKIEDILSPKMLQDAYQRKVITFASVYLENKDDKLISHQLPYQTQWSPIKGLLAYDINHDNSKEVLMVGNDTYFEVFSGVSDQIDGIILKMIDGKWEVIPNIHTGFIVRGNGRNLKKVHHQKLDKDYIFAPQYGDSLRVFSIK